jgi:hypothetical protein
VCFNSVCLCKGVAGTCARWWRTAPPCALARSASASARRAGQPTGRTRHTASRIFKVSLPHKVHIYSIQSVTVYVPSSELGLSHPLSSKSECAPPPGTKGGRAYWPAGEEFGESQFRRLEKSLELCLLCCLPALEIKTNADSTGVQFRNL